MGHTRHTRHAGHDDTRSQAAITRSADLSGTLEHVLRRTRMTYEGTLRHTMQLRDGWRDSKIFSILRGEWEAP